MRSYFDPYDYAVRISLRIDSLWRHVAATKPPPQKEKTVPTDTTKTDLQKLQEIQTGYDALKAGYQAMKEANNALTTANANLQTQLASATNTDPALSAAINALDTEVTADQSTVSAADAAASQRPSLVPSADTPESEAPSGETDTAAGA